MRRLTLACVIALVLVPAAAAQKDRSLWAGSSDVRPNGDYEELVLTDGVRYEQDGLEFRAERGFALIDRLDFAAVRQRRTDEGALPRRSTQPPSARRLITRELLQQRWADFLQAARHGRPAPPARTVDDFPLGLIDALYLEGDVVVVNDGLEIARAATVYLSLQEDRAVFTGVELRLRSVARNGAERILVVRGPELVRQGTRTTGRDLSLTTCTAGEPHFEVIAGQAEIIQHADQFEVRMRDAHLAVSGTRVLPLPNTSFFTGEQSQLPLRSVSVGFNNREGANAEVGLGASFNELGGSLHHALTGRPADEFRGDWNLDVGWIERRGWPIEGGAIYRADGLYRGRVRQFAMDDGGPNIREIRNRLDGSPIDDRGRRVTHTENRIELGAGTTLDLSLFHATDAAVWSEFYPREYREDEIPETSAHFRHASDNRLLTATGRWNLAGYTYKDDRALAPAFREELPVATFDWFSEELATLPYDVPLLLTASTDLGQRRSKYDRTFALPVDDDTFRASQELELATPFHLGPLGVRPFASARFVHYDNSLTGADLDRWAFAAGVRTGTWLARSWGWTDSDGSQQSLRHVMSPTVTFLDRFHVDGDPTDVFQFDDIDALDERAEIRFELLNRLQRHRRGPDGDRVDEFVWLDLAQTVTPLSYQNNDHHLGLFEFELILRPAAEWVPIPNLRLLFEGEHDWNQDDQRTLNTSLRFGPVLGLDWYGEYRTDRTTDGAIGYGASTSLFGRWGLAAGGQYDLDRSENLNYLAQITRTDHDWRILFGASFDLVTDTTSYFVNFEPTLGGLIEPRAQRQVTRQRLWAGDGF